MNDLIGASDRLVASRKNAVNWLLDRIDSNGRPQGAEAGNGWSRLPWTLALAGETGAAHAVLEWAAREAMDPSGNFREGPAISSFNVYKLGQVAMGALLLERYDMANLVLDFLEKSQHANGGFAFDLPGGPHENISEMFNTFQAGMAALLGGREEMARRARDWVMDILRDQPDLPDMLYVGRIGDQLVTQPPQGYEFALMVDYRKPLQSYNLSGAAAAFLGLYAMRHPDADTLAAGHLYLDLNIGGTEDQFNDLETVQVCKFGWGAAVMQIADPSSPYRPHLLQMTDWFIDRQAEDGSWTFSKFLAPSPTIVQTMMKTAEHAMEVTAMIAALNVLAARS
jgi:hypothetical protein